MPDNFKINSTTQADGPTYRDIDKAGIKTQVVTLDLGGAGAESLMTGTLPVTGTFFQATQPVSGPVTDTQLRATAVPISGTVTANAGTGTLAVSLATAPTTPVTGTFWQATQPISLATLPVTNAGTFAVQSAATLTAETTKVIGTINIAASQTVGLVAGVASIGAVTNTNLDVLLSTRLKPADTLAAVTTVTTVAAVTAITNALPAGTNILGALVANQSTNTAQIAGVVPTLNTGVVTTGTQRVVLATDVILAAVSEIRAATLHVTATAAANTAATASLPAAGAGLFHYITNITLMRNATAALAGTATLIHTSTNLPGTPAWSVGNAMAAGGTQLDLNYSPTTPLRSAAVNTITTVVMAAGGAAVLNRINVSYFTAV